MTSSIESTDTKEFHGTQPCDLEERCFKCFSPHSGDATEGFKPWCFAGMVAQVSTHKLDVAPSVTRCEATRRERVGGGEGHAKSRQHTFHQNAVWQWRRRTGFLQHAAQWRHECPLALAAHRCVQAKGRLGHSPAMRDQAIRTMMPKIVNN